MGKGLHGFKPAQHQGRGDSRLGGGGGARASRGPSGSGSARPLVCETAVSALPVGFWVRIKASAPCKALAPRVQQASARTLEPRLSLVQRPARTRTGANALALTETWRPRTCRTWPAGKRTVYYLIKFKWELGLDFTWRHGLSAAVRGDAIHVAPFSP